MSPKTVSLCYDSGELNRRYERRFSSDHQRYPTEVGVTADEVMALIKATSKPLYIYILYRPTAMNGREPFYVGKGKDDRLLDHAGQARNQKYRSHKHRAIRKIWALGGEIDYEIVEFFEDEFRANWREIFLIKVIGRRDLGRGPLCNKTDGGDGVANLPEDTRRKISDALRNWWSDNPPPPKGPNAVCKHCGIPFISDVRFGEVNTYCSNKCYGESKKGRHPELYKLEDRECLGCGQMFHPRGKTKRYCSPICRTLKRTVRCDNCGEPFKRQSVKNRFCSHECSSNAHRGLNNNKYKTGSSVNGGLLRYPSSHLEFPGQYVHNVVWQRSSQGKGCFFCDDVVVIVKHIDGDKMNNAPGNLAGLCSKCRRGGKSRLAACRVQPRAEP